MGELEIVLRRSVNNIQNNDKNAHRTLRVTSSKDFLVRTGISLGIA